MKPTTLNSFIGSLFEIGLVSQSYGMKTSPIGDGRLLIEVGDTGQTANHVPEYENSLQHYVDLFNEGKYSLLMLDGGLIFLKYHFTQAGSQIAWHRFGYMPAVVKLDVGAGEGPGDLPPPDTYISTPRRASLRFEYAPEEAADLHPASHVHINAPNCRIPVTSRLGVAEFMHFVVENFYPEFLTAFSAILPAAIQYHDDLAVPDRQRFRIAAPDLQQA
ncbi:DUF2290 domain-containing protein [Mesorhizobium sp. B3-1-3]|uniref:DUF2290 domain-containing protein n=1 Tax=unclassified Mesorhizobium TaxID=325217 RepID=UPI00112C618F|nr:MULTISPECIES: DUF2290 domain-containing protein [unclassified Mesorhizobium]TPI58457.1 DUF2290 domain-containing protein [Mesorhizobium sp. B3-1-8]TPI67293.1 DUF2290 domain-containing protein [Mesorhizobium sp. B3-1-3]